MTETNTSVPSSAQATTNNTAPTTKSSWLNIYKNTSFTFEVNHFNFADEDTGDTLVSIEVVSVRTTSGTLVINGQPLQSGQILTPTDISSLKYTPSQDAFGDNMVSITYRVSDGNDWSMNGILSIAVKDKTSNTAPTSHNFAVDVPEDLHEYRFTKNDFPFTDVDSSDRLEAVEITSLKIHSGTFRVNGRDVKEGDVIALNMLITGSGGLAYKPEDNVTGNEMVEFQFRVYDGEEYSPTYQYYIDVIDTPEPNIGKNATHGTSGADSLNGTSENDTLVGGNGDDFLRGGPGNDNIEGGDGNDNIFAGPGDQGIDYFIGNAGNDVIGGGEGNDYLVGGNVSYSHTDTLSSQDAGSDTIFGGSGNDKIYGSGISSPSYTGPNAHPLFESVTPTGTAPNTLWAGSGNDTVYGDNGHDLIGAGSGNDYIWAFEGNDTIFGGIGSSGNHDTIQAGDGNDIVYASVGNDSIFGGNGDDTLYGGIGHDHIIDNGGVSTIFGGNGDDSIEGGADDDQLTGGSGDDTFGFYTGFGTDTITDFETGDKLDFTNIDGLTIETITSTATYSDGNTTLTVGNHGTIILQDVTESELQSYVDAGQIILSGS